MQVWLPIIFNSVLSLNLNLYSRNYESIIYE